MARPLRRVSEHPVPPRGAGARQGEFAQGEHDPAAATEAGAPGGRGAWLRRLARFARGRVPRRRVLAWTGVGVLVVLVSGAWGVATASADASLGPHEARYEVTVDGAVTVDLGPLGTLVIDSPLPVNLGARVVVGEIPRGVDAFGGADTLEALSADLERYVQFFSAPEATMQVAVRALVQDAVRRTLLATALLGGSVVGLHLLLGRVRRRQLRTSAQAHRTALVGGLALVLVVPATLTASGQRALDAPPGQAASPVFDGTPLEGARLTGRLAGVLDTYGAQVLDAYRENQEFYATATENLAAAWAPRRDAEVRATAVGPAEDDGADDGPGASTPVADLVTLLVVTDLHCNVGMEPVIRAATVLSEADVVLNAGDTTANGTSVESYCVDALVGAPPDGVPVVVADGNHDSELTSDQERDVGAIVLDGGVVEVAGVRILGDRDPRATRIGSGTSLVGDESAEEVADRLARTACDDGAVDLLLVHDPRVARPALEQGCVPAAVSGHMHRRIGPERVGDGVLYVNASSAGAALGQPTVGPLNGTAELTVLRFDPVNRTLVDHMLVQVAPDTSARVGYREVWPGSTVFAPFPRVGRAGVAEHVR